MSNNHITYFKVENFKKFDSLEVKDIGQFNLIVGDNNVGKTCLLEALLVDEDSQQLMFNFWLGLKKRGLTFQIEEITKKIGSFSSKETVYSKENYYLTNIIKKSKNSLNFSYHKKTNEELNFDIKVANKEKLLEAETGLKYGIEKEKSNKLSFNGYDIKTEDLLNQFLEVHIILDNTELNQFPFQWIYDFDDKNYNYDYIYKFPLVSFNDTPLEELSRKIYENLKTKKEKGLLINVLKVINPTIIDVELRENFEDLKSVFLISFEDKDEFVPLNFLGDGFKRIFYIVLKALSLKGRRLLIDEIEIGIHHSKMKDFWVNIIKICKELEIQLFTTTHSRFCIEDFVKALEIVDCKDDARLIQLKLDKTNTKVYATSLFYQHIKTGLNSNLKMLGK